MQQKSLDKKSVAQSEKISSAVGKTTIIEVLSPNGIEQKKWNANTIAVDEKNKKVYIKTEKSIIKIDL